jgi:hypothetical protein
LSTNIINLISSIQCLGRGGKKRAAINHLSPIT